VVRLLEVHTNTAHHARAKGDVSSRHQTVWRGMWYVIENAAERPDMPHQLFYNATAALPVSTCCYIFVLVLISCLGPTPKVNSIRPIRLDSTSRSVLY
jgi:hypothetical protein